MPGDITFNSGTSWFGQNLTNFVLNGTIAASRVDDMATRILASWYLLKQDSAGYPAGMSTGHHHRARFVSHQRSQLQRIFPSRRINERACRRPGRSLYSRPGDRRRRCRTAEE